LKKHKPCRIRCSLRFVLAVVAVAGAAEAAVAVAAAVVVCKLHDNRYARRGRTLCDW
jgi:hypothetical protein